MCGIIKGILTSKTINKNCTEIVKCAVSSLLSCDPVEALEFVKNLRKFPSTVRDGIFIENLQVFLLNLHEYDPDKPEFVAQNLNSFVRVLADVSPNEEAGYRGEPEKLTEYAMRIVKMIDDCETTRKSYYLACLARAVLAKFISSREFFKFAHCIRNLTDEDLQFLKTHVKEKQSVIFGDDEYIDDFRALGLMKDVDGGFAYTERAFKLVKYSLDYDGNLELPAQYPDRFRPENHDALSPGEIDKVLNDTSSNE